MKRLCIIAVILGLVAIFTADSQAASYKHCKYAYGEVFEFRNITTRHWSCTKAYATMFVWELRYRRPGVMRNVEGLTCRSRFSGSSIIVRCTKTNAPYPNMIRWRVPAVD
jgi:hypothetical protein